MRTFERLLAAIIGAAALLTGCGAEFQNPATPNAPAPQVTETVPVVTETVPAAGENLQFGDIIYTVDCGLDGVFRASRHAVVAKVGDTVIVTAAISDSAEALRECLPHAFESWADARFGDCIDQIRASDCCGSWEEAQYMAEELNSGR